MHRAELCDTSGILTGAMALNLKDRDDKGHDTIKKNGRIGKGPHLHNKLNRKKLPLWSCFAFITRNIDQNMATKSLYAQKTAENSHS